MAMPSNSTEAAVQLSATASPADTTANADGDSMDDIPRRLMRVKVLYTFDDENKSNCLARLPNALNIPTVYLDETTQVGVIELKTCIQAVVAASPELVAKLGHDYTVYAYDYSEYETPLVGQGMLSWVLASASATPNAPADQSQTMVTGRVCKNILGLFSNGIKETLEVKLKLVPVPTCMQSEYVENLERYHNLSKIVPEDLPADYNAWAEFLKANPAIRQLAQPFPAQQTQPSARQQSGGVESFHDMLTRQGGQDDAYHGQDTRASSPAMSTISFYPYSYQHQPRRPSSQASFHSEGAAHGRHLDLEEQEDGPPKKRARIQKAQRPKKSSALGTHQDSLRVTASSAASVRNHRPLTANTGAAVSIEQVPRAPTPRPGSAGKPMGRFAPRLPAPSLLRNASVDDNRPYMSPYDTGIFSDNAMESADERGRSPADTPTNMPSSPPIMPRRTLSPARSSPELPSLPPNDSGFVSDLPAGRDEDEADRREKPWGGFESGQADGRPATGNTACYRPNNDTDFMRSFHDQMTTVDAPTLPPSGEREGQKPAPLIPPTGVYQLPPNPQPMYPTISTTASFPATYGDPSKPPPVHAAQRPAGMAKARGLPRSHTWSGAEPMSDGALTTDEKAPQPKRRGQVKRRDHIRQQLQEALSKGEMPTYCGNCGQIDTPTWRRAFMKVVEGVPNNIELTSVGTGITAYEVIEPEDDDDDTPPRYRIFKQSLTEAEWEVFKEASANKTEDLGNFKELKLCNPCGLWLNKKNAMRPHRVWAKSNKPAGTSKRNRNRKKQAADQTMSDAVMPESEANIPEPRDESEAPPSLDGTVDEGSQQSLTKRMWSARSGSDFPMDDGTAQAALLRAIQSSPVGLSGSRDSPIEVEGDLTPKPTRRLLFPSPRRSGETKSLADQRSSMPELTVEDTDKENCPPTAQNDTPNLFNEPAASRTTPSKVRSADDLLKTPTLSSRRIPFTPKRNADNAEILTPTRAMRTPKTGGKLATAAPETPFTRQLNALLSDYMPSSPSQAIDFSNFPTFTTPGRNNEDTSYADFLNGDFSSDFPMPSSPPTALNFSVFEDPNTSTVSLWSGASIFDGSDTVIPDVPAGDNAGSDQPKLHMDLDMLKMQGISADFAVLIAQVAGDANSGTGEKTPSANGQSPAKAHVSETPLTADVPTVSVEVEAQTSPNKCKTLEAHTGLSDAVTALNVDATEAQPKSPEPVGKILEQTAQGEKEADKAAEQTGSTPAEQAKSPVFIKNE